MAFPRDGGRGASRGTAGGAIGAAERRSPARPGQRRRPRRKLHHTILPTVAACQAPPQGTALLTALSGSALDPAPGVPLFPGGAHRGRLDTLPTAANFFSVDSRTVPTQTAWALRLEIPPNLPDRAHLQTEGDLAPPACLITAWGTSKMRTGGDNIRPGPMALMGRQTHLGRHVPPRDAGFEILPPHDPRRPRVDVTLRISGFFRRRLPRAHTTSSTAPPRAVQALDEPEGMNAAAQAPGPRIYGGAKPGAYGAGLQALIDEASGPTAPVSGRGLSRLGAATPILRGRKRRRDREGLETRLPPWRPSSRTRTTANTTSSTRTTTTSSKAARPPAVRHAQGRDRPGYHKDHSRPESPRIRHARRRDRPASFRSRVGESEMDRGRFKRHGYKGAFEISAAVDYLFAFAATTRRREAPTISYFVEKALPSKTTPPAPSSRSEPFGPAGDRPAPAGGHFDRASGRPPPTPPAPGSRPSPRRRPPPAR